MPVLRQWHAHDCVRSMSAILSKRDLISTGFDHLVRIWALDGTLLGTLRQGQTIAEDWLFQPNRDAKMKALNIEASEIMYDLGIGEAPEHLSSFGRNGVSNKLDKWSEEDGVGEHEHDS